MEEEEQNTTWVGLPEAQGLGTSTQEPRLHFAVSRVMEDTKPREVCCSSAPETVALGLGLRFSFYIGHQRGRTVELLWNLPFHSARGPRNQTHR